MSEARDSSSEDKSKKLALRSLWKIGEKFPVNFAPSVEGLVVGMRWRDGILSVILITPPFQKLGGTWAEASLLIKPASSFSQKPLPDYDYPFPVDKRIVQEALKANGNIEMLQELVGFLNKITPNPSGQEVEKTQTSSPASPWEVENGNQSQEELQNLEDPPVSAALSSSKNWHISKEELFSEDLMNKLATELSRRISIASSGGGHQQKENSPKSPKSTSSFLAIDQNDPSSVVKQKLKHKKRRHKSSSSSSTSSSSSDSSSSNSEVGSVDKKRGKGWFRCPFSVLDSRQITLPRTTMKGRHEERKMIRKALHNLYSHFTTLKWYVDSLKVENSTGAFKPFANDLLWLSHHASYLDHLLLHDTRGPWAAWNELSIDYVAKAFLELLVRSSPTRNYPEILDEKVRRWMKKKRVGMAAQFGPVPSYLSDATITDSGVQVKGGWAMALRRDNRSFPSSNSANFRTKQPFPGSQATDKKPPVPLPQ